MRILIVEDNTTLAAGLKSVLTGAGYAVDVSLDGKEAAHILSYQPYDLLLLDLSLPGMDGIDLLKGLRARKIQFPVLIISARDRLDQRIMGLDSGADDYICKPFELDEILARVRALLRRTYQQGSRTLEINDLSINFADRSVKRKGRRLNLSRREFSVFECLVNNVGRVVSKDTIADHISDFDEAFNPYAIETYVCRLRKKLGTSIKIQTVHGLGYLIEKPADHEKTSD